jgi:hypothetical protein
VPFPKSLSSKDGTISFNVSEYTKKLLQVNSLTQKAPEFQASYSNWYAKLVGDPKDYVRGHDFVFLVSWVIRALKGVEDYSSEIAIERLLVLFAERADALLKTLA